MPIYTFRNTDTGEEKDYTMSISDYDDFVASNKTLVRVYQPLNIGFTYNRKKPSQGFRDRLRDIKKNHKGSTINVS